MTIGTYPPLPPFYKLYKDYIKNPKSAPKPPPPFEGTYVCYGGNYTVISLYLSYFLIIYSSFRIALQQNEKKKEANFNVYGDVRVLVVHIVCV
jgi:mediator of RNA polymerase II transcription subunit 7